MEPVALDRLAAARHYKLTRFFHPPFCLRPGALESTARGYLAAMQAVVVPHAVSPLILCQVSIATF